MENEKADVLSCLQRRKLEIVEVMQDTKIALDFYKDQAQKHENFLKKKQAEKNSIEKQILELVENEGERTP